METKLDETRAVAGNGARGEIRSEPKAEAATVLAASDSLQGSLSIKSGGQLLGRFSGQVECDGELVVGRDAEVTADVRTRNLTIAGTVRGNVVATGRLKLTATGRLEGDARVGALVVQEGGVHHGAIRVHPEGLPDEPAPVEPEAFEPSPAPSPPAGMRLAASVGSVKKLWGELF